MNGTWNGETCFLLIIKVLCFVEKFWFGYSFFCCCRCCWFILVSVHQHPSVHAFVLLNNIEGAGCGTAIRCSVLHLVLHEVYWIIEDFLYMQCETLLRNLSKIRNQNSIRTHYKKSHNIISVSKRQPYSINKYTVCPS